MSHEFRHSDESVEHGTPVNVVEAEYDVLGSIDLDPASSPLFNRAIGARRIYTVEDNGYAQPWTARTVHLNPPGGKCDVTGRPVYAATKKRQSCLETGACGLPAGRREGGKLVAGHAHKGVTSAAKAWWFKLAEAWMLGAVEHAIYVAFNLDVFQTTQIRTPRDPRGDWPLPVPLDFDFCVPRVRLEYLAPTGDGVEAGESPTHASAVVLLSRDQATRERFKTCFSAFGKIVSR